MDIEELKRLIIYDPISGTMTRTDKVRSPNGVRKNVTIMIDYKIYQRNQIAWALAYGCFHKGLIYHLDGDPMNFSLSNLTSTRPKRERRRHRDGKFAKNG